MYVLQLPPKLAKTFLQPKRLIKTQWKPIKPWKNSFTWPHHHCLPSASLSKHIRAIRKKQDKGDNPNLLIFLSQLVILTKWYFDNIKNRSRKEIVISKWDICIDAIEFFSITYSTFRTQTHKQSWCQCEHQLQQWVFGLTPFGFVQISVLDDKRKCEIMCESFVKKRQMSVVKGWVNCRNR